MPHSPISLDDHELDLLLRAAAQIEPALRNHFLCALAQAASLIGMRDLPRLIELMARAHQAMSLARMSSTGDDCDRWGGNAA
jgi:hypothetical protein